MSPLFPYTTLFRSALTHDLRAGTYHPPSLEMMAPYGITDDMHRTAIRVPRWQMRDRQEGVIVEWDVGDRKSTRLNSSHPSISYAVFCLKKKTQAFSKGTSSMSYVQMSTIMFLLFSAAWTPTLPVSLWSLLLSYMVLICVSSYS